MTRAERVAALKEHIYRRIQNVTPNMTCTDLTAQVWLETIVEVVAEWRADTLYELERKR